MIHDNQDKDRMGGRIREKLTNAFCPSVLEIVNDSVRHAGHAGDDGSGETHYRVLIVSELFAGKGRVDRQRQVYNVLAPELKEGVHALALKVLAPSEYDGM